MKKIKHKKRIVAAVLLLGAVAAFSYPGSPVPQLARFAADQIGIKAVTDFAVIVNSGNTLEMQPFSSTGIYRTNGTVAAGDLATVTVTRPDTTTFSFRQRIDTDGRIRGLLFGENLNQVGTYTLTIAADNGGTNSGQFGVRTKPVLSNDNTFTGNNTFTGTILHKNAADSADAFQIQTAAGADILDVNTLTSLVTVANLTVTGTCTGCGSDTLQSAYNAGNTITTTDSRDVDVTLADTATDSNFVLDVASGSTSEFQVENNGTDVLQIGSAGQLQLDTQGSGGGLAIGGDTNLYRSAAGLLGSDNDLELFGTSASVRLDNAGLVDITRVAAGNSALRVLVTGEANPRYRLFSDGELDWGDGTASPDTNLYRSAADTLQTDDTFIATKLGNVDPGTNLLQAQSSGTRYTAVESAGTLLVRYDDNSSATGTIRQQNLSTDASGGSQIRVDLGDDASNPIVASVIRTIKEGAWTTTASTQDSALVLRTTENGTGNEAARLTSARQLQLPGTASTAGILIGGDANLYRSAANVLKTDDTLAIGTLGTADTSTALCRNTSQEVATCTSSREYKKDIEPLDGNQYQSILETIAGTDIFTFRYKGPDTALRTGVIAENLPKELTPTIDPKGNPQPDWFSIYGYLWAGEKALIERVNSLEERLNQVTGASDKGASSDHAANVEVERGKKKVEVRFATPRPNAEYAIQVTPSWVTAYAATKKTANGFVIEFDKKAPKNAAVDWTIVQ